MQHAVPHPVNGTAYLVWQWLTKPQVIALVIRASGIEHRNWAAIWIYEGDGVRSAVEPGQWNFKLETNLSRPVPKTVADVIALLVAPGCPSYLAINKDSQIDRGFGIKLVVGPTPSDSAVKRVEVSNVG